MQNPAAPPTPQEDLYTPVAEALAELRRRRATQPALAARIAAALGGDIPDYLRDAECFVLARHVSTPNHEAFYVLDQARQQGARAVFSQDPTDRFTSVNNLKRRLARPEVCAGPREARPRRYRKVDLVDIGAAEGQPIHAVRTRSGEPLVAFHNRLFGRVSGADFRVADDSAWIDRNARGDLPRHYERYLSLFVVHGVLFEDFDSDADPVFLEQIVRPQIARIEAAHGLRPLIVRPYPPETGVDERFDLAHPETVFPPELP